MQQGKPEETDAGPSVTTFPTVPWETNSMTSRGTAVPVTTMPVLTSQDTEAATSEHKDILLQSAQPVYSFGSNDR